MQRSLIVILSLCFLGVSPPAAEGQQAAEMPRVGLLSWRSCDKHTFSLFLRGLAELGYQSGETVAIECRSAGSHDQGLTRAAAELVGLDVDVIVTTSQPAGRAARMVTDTIPIVTAFSGDPVASGAVQSIAKPGGNVTGVSYYATELTAKRLALLKEVTPQIETIGVLANPVVSYLPFEEDTKRAANQLGIALRFYHVGEPVELAAAFNKMKAENVQAVFVLPDLMLSDQAGRIATLALEHRLPTMAWGT